MISGCSSPPSLSKAASLPARGKQVCVHSYCLPTSPHVSACSFEHVQTYAPAHLRVLCILLFRPSFYTLRCCTQGNNRAFVSGFAASLHGLEAGRRELQVVRCSLQNAQRHMGIACNRAGRLRSAPNTIQSRGWSLQASTALASPGRRSRCFSASVICSLAACDSPARFTDKSLAVIGTVVITCSATHVTYNQANPTAIGAILALA